VGGKTNHQFQEEQDYHTWPAETLNGLRKSHQAKHWAQVKVHFSHCWQNNWQMRPETRTDHEQ